eukprot:COSAG06_NODE_6227_length_3032_cov_149.678145_5_plen_71_part_01
MYSVEEQITSTRNNNTGRYLQFRVPPLPRRAVNVSSRVPAAALVWPACAGPRLSRVALVSPTCLATSGGGG